MNKEELYRLSLDWEESYIKKCDELQAYKDKEDKLREYLKGLEKDNLKDLSEFEPKYIFESIIFALEAVIKNMLENEDIRK